MLNTKVILIGYSGHAFVACGIILAAGKSLGAYCDNEEKKFNPFELVYLGKENETAALEAIAANEFFIAVGDNNVRQRIQFVFEQKKFLAINIVHPSAVVDPSATVAPSGVMIAANATINPLAKIGTGAICNSGCIIEHECRVGDFAHIGPGAVLCGNVKIGETTFVGANSVVRQGISIGNNVMIGAGSVVVKDVPDNVTVMGNPARVCS